MTLIPGFPRKGFKIFSLISATVIAALGIAYAGHVSRAQALAERDTAAAAMADLNSSLKEMEQTRVQADQQKSLFLRLEASGLVGEPAFLDWAELLEQIRQEMGLPALRYEFVQPSTLQKDSGSDFDFHITSMRLSLHTLHEEDLLRFLSRLQNEANALVIVRSCRLSRRPGAGSSSVSLLAECELDWAVAYGQAAERP